MKITRAIVLFLILGLSGVVHSSYQRLPVPPGTTGPESVAFDNNNRGPYTGISDGRVMKWDSRRHAWTQFSVPSNRRYVTQYLYLLITYFYYLDASSVRRNFRFDLSYIRLLQTLFVVPFARVVLKQRYHLYYFTRIVYLITYISMVFLAGRKIAMAHRIRLGRRYAAGLSVCSSTKRLETST